MLENYDKKSILEFWANNETGLEPDITLDHYINLGVYRERHGKKSCPDYTFNWFNDLKRSASELGIFTGLQICFAECKASGFDFAQVRPEIKDFFSVATSKDADRIAATARAELTELMQYGNISNAHEIASYNILKGVNNAVNAFRSCVDPEFDFFEIQELKQSLKKRAGKALKNGKKTFKR